LAIVRFVILAAPRTGSNMLCTLLGSHPDVLCHHELFNPDGIFYALDLRDGSLDLGDLEQRDRDPVAFLERIWSEHRGHSHVGFKMTHRQNEAVLDAVLRDRGVRKVVLRRRNRVRTYVSRLISEQTGRWEVYDEAELGREQPRVRVDVVALRQSVAENDAYYDDVERSLRDVGRPYLDVCYERLVAGEERTRLLEFLGLPHPDRAAATLRVRSVRQNPGTLRELVVNYDELAGAVAGTALAGDLDGG
jgi:LPS sulfotransferase NodH